MNYAELFIRDQIPLKTQTLIPATLKTAYAATRTLVASEPMLSVASAQDNYGRLISFAVDFGFQKLIESGQWNCDFRWQHFSKPTGRYLEIILPQSVVTISQVADPKRQPRDVSFRSNKRLNNQGCLDFYDFKKEQSISGLPHILLVHGHQNLNFAHLGMPSENNSVGYIFRTENLMNLPHEIKSHEPPTENTDFEAVMTLKEEIDKWRKDNGE